MTGLPSGDIAWPPASCEKPYQRFTEWGAWWSGSIHQLSKVYSGQYGTAATGAVLGTARYDAPFFWGAPVDPSQMPIREHVPIAGDIAATSANLLFADPPTLKAEDETTQQRIDDLMQDGLHALLLEAAEIAAAFGGVFIKVDWDLDVADTPIAQAIQPERAVPEFQWGRLRACTFWTEVAVESGKVYRHLERHEPGVVFHGLYEGTGQRLGHRVPLETLPATKPYAKVVGEDGAIPTGLPRLACVYVPNMRPSRTFKEPALGRSDFSGNEKPMDSLDMTLSALMRDIHLGKARLIVPQDFLLQAQDDKGKGAWFDLEASVFTPLDVLTDSGGLRQEITMVQPNLRYQEHLGTANHQIQQIIRGAGYSAQTFGLAQEGTSGQQTATETHARERASLSTRGKKLLYWIPQLRELLEILLAIDARIFASGVTPQRIEIKFPDAVKVDQLSLAQTVQAFKAAGAASLQTLVRLAGLVPDDQVDEEVARIEGEAPEPAVPAQPPEQDSEDEGDSETPPERGRTAPPTT
ncbi:phage portal protein [Streptomyces hirsutus]|uniref:phage portal protein n=1 Tax=Streptomyces hirsutus TaxID=35620 RepID=UPI00333215FC